jgi:DNA invertase Pin-like site-specific DNA recombinase
MKEYARPAGYLRLSSADDDQSPEAQREGQIAAIHALAVKDGHQPQDVVIYDDWDRSADPAKENRRTQFAAMLKAAEEGSVSAIYARSLDRLYRSPRTFYRLMDVAKAYGVRVITQREGLLGGDDSPMAQAFASITAVFSELELNTAKARARARVAHQRARGDVLGQKPYGDGPDEDWRDVVDAFREAGSWHGAARLLIERGVPSRRSNRTTAQGVPLGWEASTISRIVRLRAPELVPAKRQRGARIVGPHLFSRLLICPHDHSILSTSARPKVGSATYVCRIGHRAPKGQHPRPYTVAESMILPWAHEEVKRAGSIKFHGRTAAGVDADLHELDARVERAGRALVLGALSEAQVAEIVSEVETMKGEIAEAGRARWTMNIGVDWSKPAGEVNRALRALWRGIELDAKMRPVRALWIVDPDEAVRQEAALEAAGMLDQRGYTSEELKAMGRKG